MLFLRVNNKGAVFAWIRLDEQGLDYKVNKV